MDLEHAVDGIPVIRRGTLRQRRSPLRRRMTAGQILLVVVLLVVVGATQLLSVRSYRDLAGTTESFSLAQNVTGTLADAQRDALGTALALERLARGTGSLRDAQFNVGFLGQQLRTLEAAELPVDADVKVTAAFARQQEISRALDAVADGSGSEQREAAAGLRVTADQLAFDLRGLYARFEISFYDRLRLALASRTDHQAWIVGGAVVAALIGLGLAFSLRRTVRSDFEDAYALLVRETGEREAAQSRHTEELAHLAYHDRVTGLPNRLSLEREIDALVRDGRPATLVALDLDGLGELNRQHGVAAGDELLRTAARRLDRVASTGALGSRATVAHLGGDEFAVLVLGERAIAEATHCGGLLLAAIAEPIPVAGRTLLLTACAGVASGAFADHHDHEILRHADAALHQAKIEGAGSIAVFDEQRHRALQEQSALAQRLALAEGAGELVLHYQPLVDAIDGSALGVEGLIRWNRDGVLVPPAEFIPAAEESGLIIPVGAWVIERVCADLSALRATSKRGELYGSVNLAARQLHDPGLIDHIATCLTRYSLEPSSLVVELTETAIIDDPERAEAVLAALRSMGVRVAIDDFGTGYSSLGYLRQIPADILKLDRSLVSDVTADERSVRLLEGIVTLAHDLGMRVTVEGIETPEQLAVVRAAGCDTVQGYLVSRPKPTPEVDAVLAGLGAPWALGRGATPAAVAA